MMFASRRLGCGAKHKERRIRLTSRGAVRVCGHLCVIDFPHVPVWTDRSEEAARFRFSLTLPLPGQGEVRWNPKRIDLERFGTNFKRSGERDSGPARVGL